MGASERPDPVEAEARRWHFGEFFGLKPLPEGDGPLVVVHGNCQAGSIRRLLESAGARAIRIPPVHELTSAEVPRLHQLVAQADALVTQPITNGYRELAVGTDELADLLPARARLVKVPVLRFAGAFPFHVTVRPAFAPSINPAVVPYHDLRTAIIARELPDALGLSEAAERRFAELTALVDEDAVNRLTEASVGALRSRETAHGTVWVADLLAEDVRRMRTHHTLNHPTNAWFLRAVAPVIDALGGLPGQPQAPGFEMLGGIEGQIEPVVARVLPIPPQPWRIGSVTLTSLEIADAQLRWYRKHPGFVAATLERHRETVALLGLPGLAA